MYYGAIKPNDIADGPGVRVALYVSGCRIGCKGCHNPEAQDFNYGTPYSEDTEKEILKLMEPEHVAGFSLLGGEPFEPENQEVLVGLLKKIREAYPRKTIWAYTGYVLSDLQSGGKKHTIHTDEMLSLIDVLVDGPFIESQKNISLAFRGSENQNIIELNFSGD